MKKKKCIKKRNFHNLNVFYIITPIKQLFKIVLTSSKN